MVFLMATPLSAHPGSGIVVDHQGNVYFVDTGSGIWKIEKDGKLTRLAGPAYHWMAIDLDRRLSNVTLPYFSSGDATVTRVGRDVGLLVSSDFPITVGQDGALYYPWRLDGERWQVFRLSGSGATTVFTTPPSRSESGPLRWINGVTSGSDGSIYYTEDRAVRKINVRGECSTVVDNPGLTGCDSVPGLGSELGPHFRGICVDHLGNVYVAATGCRSVLKITAGKIAATLLRSPSPWSPTGVAAFGDDIFVLEYLHTANDNRREWLPRVRKISATGEVVTVATIDRR